jgi:hypothetical protein
VGGETADHEVDLLVLDQLLGPLGADGRLELVVTEQDLELASHDAALGVDLLVRELGAPMHVGGDGGERAGQREWEADADRILALGAQHGGEGQDGGSGRCGRQELASMHGSLRYV